MRWQQRLEMAKPSDGKQKNLSIDLIDQEIND